MLRGLSWAIPSALIAIVRTNRMLCVEFRCFTTGLLKLPLALFLIQLAGDDEHASGPEALDPAPGRGQQEIDHAVAIHVAHAGRVEAKGLAWHFASDRAQQAAVLARIQID